jgi:hypothetical protein
MACVRASLSHSALAASYYNTLDAAQTEQACDSSTVPVRTDLLRSALFFGLRS